MVACSPELWEGDAIFFFLFHFIILFSPAKGAANVRKRTTAHKGIEEKEQIEP